MGPLREALMQGIDINKLRKEEMRPVMLQVSEGSLRQLLHINLEILYMEASNILLRLFQYVIFHLLDCDRILKMQCYMSNHLYHRLNLVSTKTGIGNLVVIHCKMLIEGM